MKRLSFLSILLFLLLSSCKEDCEKENTAILTISNKTSLTINGTVDNDIDFIISSGEEFTRTYDAGTHTIVAVPIGGASGSGWLKSVTLEVCSNMEQELIQ